MPNLANHPTECFPDPGLAECTNGMSVMVSVYLQEDRDQVFANTFTNGGMTGFGTYMVAGHFLCRYQHPNASYFTYAILGASLHSTFISQPT